MAIEIRGCRAEEMSAVAALASRVFRTDGGDMGADYPLMFAPDNRDGQRIAVEQDVPVAHVGVCLRDAVLLGAPLRVASVGAVCTDPEYRGQGLASALMADAQQFARERGASLMLISGGRGLYHRLGYVTVGRFHRYHWTADQLDGARRTQVTLAGYQESDLPDVAALHQREPIRFLRSATDWQKVLNAGLLMNRPAEMLLVRQDGRTVAYMGVLQPSVERASNLRTTRIHEMAGSRAAIAAALPALLSRCGVTEVALVTQTDDVEMTVIAQDRGWEPLTIPFPGTLGVIDPQRLLSALKPILEERAASDLGVTIGGDMVTLTAGVEQYSITAPGPLAALLFGGDTEEARAIPRLEGSLGQLLARLFPIPLLWHGYNYV